MKPELSLLTKNVACFDWNDADSPSYKRQLEPFAEADVRVHAAPARARRGAACMPVCWAAAVALPTALQALPTLALQPCLQAHGYAAAERSGHTAAHSRGEHQRQQSTSPSPASSPAHRPAPAPAPTAAPDPRSVDACLDLLLQQCRADPLLPALLRAVQRRVADADARAARARAAATRDSALEASRWEARLEAAHVRLQERDATMLSLRGDLRRSELERRRLEEELAAQRQLIGHALAGMGPAGACGGSGGGGGAGGGEFGVEEGEGFYV